MPALYTIGHSTRTLEDLIETLQTHGIETLVDIRAFPMSRRLPHFNRDSLEKTLPAAKIRYLWMKALGGYRKKTLQDSPNLALRNASFRNYADYMLSEPFQEAMTALLQSAEQSRTAFMCAERVYFHCHRMLVSDWLVAHGNEVLHIDGAQPPKPHKLTSESENERRSAHLSWRPAVVGAARRSVLPCGTMARPAKENLLPMAQKTPQNLANHTRFDPPFHFFVLPVFLITWIGSIVFAVRHPCLHSVWLVVFLTAATLAAVKARSNAVKVQDRVIRLEERLRLERLLPEDQRHHIDQLNESQLIALRFASDQEVPGLAARAVAERLSRADIKKAILIWRPDYWRV